MISGVADGRVFDPDPSVEDQRLQPRPRDFAQTSGKHAIEPGRSLAAFDDDFQPSAAYLKFLRHPPRVQPGTSKKKSGTRIVDLLVPFAFRSSCKRMLRCTTNFGKRALESLLTVSVTQFRSDRRA